MNKLSIVINCTRKSKFSRMKYKYLYSEKKVSKLENVKIKFL